MPPLSKKRKVEATTSPLSTNVELLTFQNEIRKIKGLPESLASENTSNSVQNEHDYRLAEDPFNECHVDSDNNDDVRKYIRIQIQLAEKRIHKRFDILEQKLNSLLNQQIGQTADESEIVEEWIEQEGSQRNYSSRHSAEVDTRIFPIADEDTFDWFFDQLKGEIYRNALITSRWALTRNVSMRSFNISVKEFLLMHFELPVCVKYSVSGFGAKGIKKRKLDSNSLITFVFDCFNMAFPGIHTLQETSKAIVQFWGRCPDNFSKANDRAVKREFNKTS